MRALWHHMCCAKAINRQDNGRIAHHGCGIHVAFAVLCQPVLCRPALRVLHGVVAGQQWHEWPDYSSDVLINSTELLDGTLHACIAC